VTRARASEPSVDVVAARRKRKPGYRLADQAGFILRQVVQRHAAIFATGIGDELTPTQWAAMAMLVENGPCSQNRLGRMTAMDVATIKGVVERLARRGFVRLNPDEDDGRRLTVSLTDEGRDAAERNMARALRITEETLAPLSPEEREIFLPLLKRLV
jgi:DNA-binding MarR family transcriptional regulator